MASIARRSLTLGFARLSNEAIRFLSPVFMVRLLTVEDYGEYRDFLLYGTMLVPFVQFGINSSIAYFVPKEPDRERLYVSQASAFVLFSSTIVVTAIALFGNHLPSETARAYLFPLSLYVLFFCNLDIWEIYWIAKKETLKVLYYSVSRLTFRTLVVIAAAYLTNRVDWVVWTLVAFEGVRLGFMGIYAARQRVFSSEIDGASIKAQLGFFAPVGASQLVSTLNLYLGQFFVSAVLGPATLAVYTTGTYMYPIIRVFRSSIGDVIMPEIVGKRDVAPKVALGLWQRATVVYCAVMLPLAVLMFYYAPVIVETLFTSAYIGAVPIFQAYVFLLVRECFDFALPLRVVNRTRIFFFGSMMALMANTALIFLFYDRYGVLGPALAMIIAHFLVGFYLAYHVMKYCEFSLPELLPWAQIGKIAALCLSCVPVLLAGQWLPAAPLIRGAVFGTVYFCVYVGLLSLVGIPDVDKMLARLRRSFAGAGR